MATEYVILKLDGNDESLWSRWEGTVKATSARAAVSAAAKDDLQPSGEYVAIPARSWQPVTVKVETALKFS